MGGFEPSNAPLGTPVLRDNQADADMNVIARNQLYSSSANSQGIVTLVTCH